MWIRASFTLSETREHQALAGKGVAMSGIQSRAGLRHWQGGLEPVHAAQGVDGVPQQLAAMESGGSVVGEREDVARQAVQLAPARRAASNREDLAEVSARAVLMPSSRRGFSRPSPCTPGCHRLPVHLEGLPQDLAKPGRLGLDLLRPLSGVSIAPGKNSLPLYSKRRSEAMSNGGLLQSAVDHEDAARRDAVPDAELVVDVRR